MPRHLRIERDSTYSTIQQSSPDEITCGTCEEHNKAVAYCEDCSSPICPDCDSGHKRIRALKRHSVVSLNESQPTASTVSVPCIFHPDEAVKYYCSSCSCLVCSECLFAHKEHDSGRIDDSELLKKEREELQSVLPEVEEAISPIVNAIEKINEVVKRIQVNKEQAKKEIDEAFRQITDAVEKRRLELMQEVENSAVAKSTLLESQKVGLEKTSTSLQLAFEAGKVALSNYNGVELLAVKSSVYQASNQVLQESRSTDLQPVSNSSLSLAIDNAEMIESISSLGSIVMGFPYPPLCSLVGINPKLAIGIAKGSECVVTLQTRDEKGDDLVEGMAKVTAKLINPALESETVECVIKDLEDGMYEISFDNPKEGQYQLDISIDDTSIGDSPFSIKVRDYTTVSSPVTSATIQGSPAYVDIGPDNLQYVTLNGGSVEVYDSCGKKVKEIHQLKLGNKPLRGIAVDKKNEVMFVATAGTHQIIKANLDGDIIDSVGGNKGSGQLEFYYPMGLCLTKEGYLLVAEDTNRRVQVLGSDLSFIRSISCLSNVYGVSVDGAGNIHAAVTDRIEVFKITGEKVTEYGQGVLSRAGDVAFLGTTSSSKSSFSFVADHISEGKVYMFDWSENALVHSFPMGRRPLGLAVDQEGVIVVGDWNDKKLHRF